MASANPEITEIKTRLKKIAGMTDYSDVDFECLKECKEIIEDTILHIINGITKEVIK